MASCGCPPCPRHDAADHYPSILEKSATARVASLISFSSLSRFARSALSSTLTVTLSKNASTMRPQLRHRGHGGGEVLAPTARPASTLAASMAWASSLFLSLLVELGIGRAGVFALVLLLLDADDVGRALVAGQQVLAVVAVEEFASASTRRTISTRSSWPSSANTASTRSWRAPCSRSWTFRRSAKKESRSLRVGVCARLLERISTVAGEVCCRAPGGSRRAQRGAARKGPSIRSASRRSPRSRRACRSCRRARP